MWPFKKAKASGQKGTLTDQWVAVWIEHAANDKVQICQVRELNGQKIVPVLDPLDASDYYLVLLSSGRVLGIPHYRWNAIPVATSSTFSES